MDEEGDNKIQIIMESNSEVKRSGSLNLIGFLKIFKFLC
jgi:hypothetical protein